MGPIHDRPIRKLYKHTTSNLLLEIPRPSSFGNRCSETGLDKRSIMSKLLMDIYFQDTIEDSNRTSHTLPDNFRIKDGSLVPLVNEPINKLSYITSAIPNFVSITDKPTKPTSQPKIADIHLFNIRIKLQAKKLPEEIIKRMKEATNESSNTTLGSVINRWNIWYSERNMDPIYGPLREILLQTDPDTKAKDVRLLLALLAQDAGADISTILALGNWFSYNVYQRFYQRGIKNMLG
ncbi:40257_t:CDS:2 [Gigaspora margarita]|uniref:40257_t:CDS:1 n=1 Tax=Gigaspora margarita TaxID=4874 RepID=A0ABN7UDZ7_GIGMA|nr:40257_t:CDS:2 [Gigaspora margarita]